MAHPQTYKHHVRYVPGFQFGVLGLLTLHLAWTLRRVGHHPTGDTLDALLLAVALLLLAFYARRFALVVQNRLIRLEMRLRLQQILPSTLQPRIAELSLNQLIALRFASDPELPALIVKVLTEDLRDRGQIKALIQDWQPDHLRA